MKPTYEEWIEEVRKRLISPEAENTNALVLLWTHGAHPVMVAKVLNERHAKRLTDRPRHATMATR